jgi:hypothetical protein
MKRNIGTWFSVVALGVLITASVGLALRANDRQSDEHGKSTFTVDVALDGATSVLNQVDRTQPPEDRGDLITGDGNIFPAGTLPSGIANNDPNMPGKIGKIRCRADSLVPMSDVTTPAA